MPWLQSRLPWHAGTAAIPAKARREGPHPAKRTFQAIRIEVNSELSILNKTIEDGVGKLNKGGRMAIITFHSLEDRIVKNKFRDLAVSCRCPKEFPVCVCGEKAKVKVISRKAIAPTKEVVGIRYYYRYCDDIVMMSTDKREQSGDS